MAATQEERTAKAAEKRLAVGEQELRHTVPAGTRAMLDQLMTWHQVDEVSEAIQLLVMNACAADIQPAMEKQKGSSEVIRHYFRQGMRDRLAALTEELGETKDRETIWRLIAYAHSSGENKSSILFKIPRHEIHVSDNVARDIRQAGFAESLQMTADDGDE